MKISKKTLALLLAAVLLIGGAIGGTIAYLVAGTDEVKNTFTYGDINIKLDEAKLKDDGTLDEATRVTENAYTGLVPGGTYAKSPAVHVKKDSEACYVFVVPTNTSDYVSYTMADGWTLVDGTANVYYRTAAKSDADQDFKLLKDDQVTVSADLTKAQVAALNAKSPLDTLSFKAYAVQQANGSATFTAAEAWAKVGADGANAVASTTW